MRDAFSSELIKIASENPKVLLLTGDHGYGLFDGLRKRCKSQYVNMGVAEQNMVGVAAGLSRSGFLPLVYGLSSFIPVRVLEQIKIDVCHDKLPVIFLGDGAGFVYSHLGTSHQSTEDISVTRAIPNLVILSPADRYEMISCMQLAYKIGEPVYLRIGKSDRGDVHQNQPNFNIGDLLKLKNGKSGLHLIATGSMVKTAMEISKEYKNISLSSAPCLKPINKDQVISICKENKVIVTLEEHSIYGGLGSIISEIAAEVSIAKVLRIGVKDSFSEFCGTYEYLLKEHGLDLKTVKSTISRYLNNNNMQVS